MDQFSFTAPFEGTEPKMYKDSRGFVTVGVGFKLSSTFEAQSLPFEPPHEVAPDYAQCKSMAPGHIPAYYAPHMRAVLPQKAMRAIFDRRMAEFAAVLRGKWPRFDSFPEPARVALLDMAYNVGAGALTSPKKWPHLIMAVGQQAWDIAAEECGRPEVDAKRNLGTRGLFMAAHHQGVLG